MPNSLYVHIILCGNGPIHTMYDPIKYPIYWHWYLIEVFGQIRITNQKKEEE